MLSVIEQHLHLTPMSSKSGGTTSNSNNDGWLLVGSDKPPRSSSPFLTISVPNIHNGSGSNKDSKSNSDPSSTCAGTQLLQAKPVSTLTTPSSFTPKVGDPPPVGKTHIDRWALNSMPTQGTLLLFYKTVTATEACKQAQTMEACWKLENNDAAKDTKAVELSWCHAQDSDPRHGSQGIAEPPQVLTCVQVRTGNNRERWETGEDQLKSKEESNKGGEGIMMRVAR
jgi:hypothetical protein